MLKEDTDFKSDYWIIQNNRKILTKKGESEIDRQLKLLNAHCPDCKYPLGLITTEEGSSIRCTRNPKHNRITLYINLDNLKPKVRGENVSYG